MNTKTNYSYTNSFESSLGQEKSHLRKLLIFQIGTLHLALPVESVKKITHYTPMEGSGTTALGLIYVDEKEMTAIDLHQRLFRVPQPEKEGRQFLILAKNSIDELFGILVPQTPSMLDLPISQIRMLPDSYRRGDTLEIASHVTRIEDNEQLLTVFILDVDRLVPPMGMAEFLF
ncbi:chemotaxis protein CheW [Crocosphaera sp.]|uniref:chemotaxis protein CheW n=1 Tax=Crocosphaera sp. TaxID=2729996 RepID=UPI0026132EF7|nr:chemotaxis protein CheW [Crocosphaera sp.]MDJ0579564.1 chemotaxis protein CheW [Crocosphaera sp.]